MKIVTGVYETLISKAINEKLKTFPEIKYLIKKEDIDSADSNKMLAEHLSNVVSSVLMNHCFRENDSSKTISNQIEVINRILKYIEDEWNLDGVETADEQIIEQKLLRGIYEKTGRDKTQIKALAEIHPVSGYRVSNLFTGGNDISLDEEIRRDIQTADEIDLIVSFIKFEGYRLLEDDLKKFIQKNGTRLRILTTTYMGATDPKAIERLYKLSELGNVEIRASYNTKQERLHAKAYIFTRHNGFDTAYIGSSNMSRSALTKGLEWNMRVTSVENLHIINKTKATFDNYWNSDDFEPIISEEGLAKFRDAIERENGKKSGFEATEYLVRFERKTHQIRVLEQLQFEREIIKSNRNLIIAATGTGKTAISAFDFKDFDKKMRKEEGRHARLLFIVHREKILKQARSTFRSVMVDANFGEIWTGRTHPNRSGDISHLFTTIQTLNNHWDDILINGNDFYDYVVIDEVHHSMAGSYRAIFDKLSPRLFIGLTATPERMDGKDIKPDFNNRFAAEIRLDEALNQQLLTPFDYFCVTDDSVDLSNVVCKGDAYDTSALNDKYINNPDRFVIIQKALETYVNDPHECKAVCFCCSIDHADYMAKMFNKYGYKALSVTSNNSNTLDNTASMLARGDINYLCVADMLNEGIDIPEIDTVLFLRPTESLTIFLQQLGRGLRLADGKTCLTVLDFVAQANNSYNYESRFRALIGKGVNSVQREIETGFRFLPRGCSITMERQAQEYILQNIKSAIFNLNRLKREVKNFTQNTGRNLTLENFLDNFNLEWRLIYKTPAPGSWARLKNQAGIKVDGFDPNSDYIKLLEGGLRRLFHTNSFEYLSFIKALIDNDMRVPAQRTTRETKFMAMLFDTIWMNDIDKINKTYGLKLISVQHAIKTLSLYSWFVEELSTLVNLRLSHLSKTTKWIKLDNEAEIELHGCYSADEIHRLIENKLGRWNVLGTQYIQDRKIAMVFVTINKSDKDYSPSTQYEDYAISANQFHWQSMNAVSINSREGRRIVEQRNNGWKFVLFVRDSKKDEYGNTNGYYCLGLIDYESSTGERPINVVWNMREQIPGFILETAKAV